MRLIATVAALLMFAGSLFAAPPVPPVTIHDRVEVLEKEVVSLKAEVAALKKAKGVASVPEFTQVCSIDPVTGKQTCRLVRTPRGGAEAAGLCPCVMEDGKCVCVPGSTCGSSACPANAAGISYPPFGATSGCASGNCGQSGGFTSDGGCASGSCGGGNGAILRVRGGPGLIRGIFGRCR